jgi:23S rRNA (adenine2503-C2)-methyltransferase
MRLLDTVTSADNATKRVVEYDDGLVGEVSYINYPGKDIVCVPSMTACQMGCKFCFLTNKPGLAYRKLTVREMSRLVQIALDGAPAPRKPLLVSFMGAGEPLANWTAVVAAMSSLFEHHGNDPANIRFAFATMLPRTSERDFLGFTERIGWMPYRVKMHLSLHFTDDEQRALLMPRALPIAPALSLLETYGHVTGHPVEVHYALVAGVNDSASDAQRLANLLRPRKLPVKVLHYSENPRLVLKSSAVADLFVANLMQSGVVAEFYKPNGLDIGASCGQFNLDRYVQKV